MTYAALNDKQLRAWNSDAPLLAVQAGHFAGKTKFGVNWLLDQADRHPGETFYAWASSSRQLQNVTIPALQQALRERGLAWQWNASAQVGWRAAWRVYWLPGGSEIYLMHDYYPPLSCRAFWMDETLDVSVDRFRSLCGSLHKEGRGLITTTPYAFDWFYSLVKREDTAHGYALHTAKVVKWSSLDNPYFPRQTWDFMKRALPAWRFKMLYEGEFPAKDEVPVEYGGTLTA